MQDPFAWRTPDLGVAELDLPESDGKPIIFLFDPLDEYFKPRLQGFRLTHGKYAPLIPARDGSLWSEELGLICAAQGYLLRLINPATGEMLPTPDEVLEYAAVETARAEAAMERAEAEAERAEAEAERAGAEAERAIAEAERAARAEAEVARLRAELERLRGKDRP